MGVTQFSDSFRAESTAMSLFGKWQSFSSAYEVFERRQQQWRQQQWRLLNLGYLPLPHSPPSLPFDPKQTNGLGLPYIYPPWQRQLQEVQKQTRQCQRQRRQQLQEQRLQCYYQKLYSFSLPPLGLPSLWQQQLQEQLQEVHKQIWQCQRQRQRQLQEQRLQCYYQKLYSLSLPPPSEVVREVLLDAIEQVRIQGVSVGVLLCFSLSESIGMNQGALLPLDSVTRIQSSKFWMMECDTWADLLIICRWANPTTTSRYCVKCSEDTKTITTSCEHHICLLCVAKELNCSGSCPKCGEKVTAVYLDNIVKGRKRARPVEDEEVTCSKRYCMKCREETKTITTSCKHHHCLLCAAEELNSSDHNSCPQCGKKVTAMYLENIGEDGKRGCLVEHEVPHSKRTCSEDISDTKALTVEDVKRKTGVNDDELDTEIIEGDFPDLAGCFEDVETYLYKLRLTPAQRTEIKDLAHRRNTTVAMTEALNLWRQPNPCAATFRALLKMFLDLKRGDMAVKVCQYIANNQSNTQ